MCNFYRKHLQKDLQKNYRRHSKRITVILVYQIAKSPAAEFSWIEKLTRSTKNLTASGKDVQDAVDSVS